MLRRVRQQRLAIGDVVRDGVRGLRLQAMSRQMQRDVSGGHVAHIRRCHAAG